MVAPERLESCLTLEIKKKDMLWGEIEGSEKAVSLLPVIMKPVHQACLANTWPPTYDNWKTTSQIQYQYMQGVVRADGFPVVVPPSLECLQMQAFSLALFCHITSRSSTQRVWYNVCTFSNPPPQTIKTPWRLDWNTTWPVFCCIIVTPHVLSLHSIYAYIHY